MRRRRRHVSITVNALPTWDASDQLLTEGDELLDDLRTWHPDTIREPLTILGEPSIIEWDAPTPSRRRSSGLPAPIHQPWQRVGNNPVGRFTAPDTVSVCVRRKTRREVLFASGRGGRNKRKRHYNQNSKVRC